MEQVESARKAGKKRMGGLIRWGGYALFAVLVVVRSHRLSGPAWGIVFYWPGAVLAISIGARRVIGPTTGTPKPLNRYEIEGLRLVAVTQIVLNATYGLAFLSANNSIAGRLGGFLVVLAVSGLFGFLAWAIDKPGDTPIRIRRTRHSGE